MAETAAEAEKAMTVVVTVLKATAAVAAAAELTAAVAFGK